MTTPRGDDLLARLEQRAQSRYVPPAHLARIHLVRGEAEVALSLFRKALEANDPWLFAYVMSFKGSPRDPRVEALIQEALRYELAPQAPASAPYESFPPSARGACRNCGMGALAGNHCTSFWPGKGPIFQLIKIALLLKVLFLLSFLWGK